MLDNQTPKPSRWFLFLLALVFAAGGWIWLELQSAQQATERQQLVLKQQAEVRRLEAQKAAEVARQERQARRQQEAREAKQREAARLASLTPAQRRAEALRGQFSDWDGSHPVVVQAVQKRLHDPESFKHARTTYSDNGPGAGITVTMQYRAKNSFGAVVLSAVIANVSETGSLVALIEVRA